MSIETEIKEFIREQIAAGNGGKIWNNMMRRVKSAALQQAMEEMHLNKSASAAAMGINRATFRTYSDQSMTPEELRELGML